MALAELSHYSSYSRSQTLPTNLSFARSTAVDLHLFQRPRFALHLRRQLNISCSVAPSQIQSPATAVRPADPASKRECYGVFCTTYDLKEEAKTKSWKSLIRIAVSGAAGMISNHLLFKLASGEVFGQDQPISLRLLGSERSYQALEGVAMELEDSLYPLLREVSIGVNPYEIFEDAEWALLIGAKPRGPGIERAALLDINGQIFAEQIHMHDLTMIGAKDKPVNGHLNLNDLLSELHYDNWTLLHPAGRRPLARYKHSAAVAQGKLFLIGGSRNGRYFSDVQAFDFRSLTWNVLNPRDDAENLGSDSSTQQVVFPAIAAHSLVEWENKLLVVAGHSKGNSDSVIVWSIDIETMVLSVLKTHGKAPVARGGQSVTIVGSKLIIFGGEDRNRQLLNDLHILDLSTMTWAAVETKNTPPSPRFDHTATEHAGQYLFIFGGSTQSSCFSDLHVLDLQTMEWSQPDVQGVAVTPRGGHAGAAIGDLWYLVGGGNNTSGATETIVLNMSKLIWSIATDVPARDPLASEGLSLSTISIDGESLLIAFGGYNGKYSNELFVLKPKPKTTTKPKLYQSPAAAAAAASVTAAYAIAKSTDTKTVDHVDKDLLIEQVATRAEELSTATEMLTSEKEKLESNLVEIRRENTKVKGNLEDARSQQSLLAMEFKAVGSQLEAERSRCVKLEMQISDIRRMLDSADSLERELVLLRQHRTQNERDATEGQVQSSGSLLRWMTG